MILCWIYKYFLQNQLFETKFAATLTFSSSPFLCLPRVTHLPLEDAVLQERLPASPHVAGSSHNVLLHLCNKQVLCLLKRRVSVKLSIYKTKTVIIDKIHRFSQVTTSPEHSVLGPDLWLCSLNPFMQLGYEGPIILQLGAGLLHLKKVWEKTFTWPGWQCLDRES